MSMLLLESLTLLHCAFAAAAPTVLIIGASRGIGFELARQYASAGWATHATMREVAGSRLPSNITLHTLDVLDGAQVTALAADFEGKALDLLVHSAGINVGSLAKQRRVNAEAPFEVVAALLPALRRGRARRVGIVTSDLGRPSFLTRYRRKKRLSQPGCSKDNVCAYATSKQLANDKFRQLEPAWRLEGVTAVALQPGYVATDMNRGQPAKVSPEESARGLIAVLAKEADALAGHFLDYTGKRLSWV